MSVSLAMKPKQFLHRSDQLHHRLLGICYDNFLKSAMTTPSAAADGSTGKSARVAEILSEMAAALPSATNASGYGSGLRRDDGGNAAHPSLSILR